MRTRHSCRDKGLGRGDSGQRSGISDGFIDQQLTTTPEVIDEDQAGET